MTKNQFWSEDINVLFDKDNITLFFPDSRYSIVENLNSIVRLITYISILLSLLKRNLKYIIFPIISMIVTYIIYEHHPEKEQLFNIQALISIKYSVLKFKSSKYKKSSEVYLILCVKLSYSYKSILYSIFCPKILINFHLNSIVFLSIV